MLLRSGCGSGGGGGMYPNIIDDIKAGKREIWDRGGEEKEEEEELEEEGGEEGEEEVEEKEMKGSGMTGRSRTLPIHSPPPPPPLLGRFINDILLH